MQSEIPFCAGQHSRAVRPTPLSLSKDVSNTRLVGLIFSPKWRYHCFPRYYHYSPRAA